MLQRLIQGFNIVRPFNTLLLFLTSQVLGEVYYLLYANDWVVPSKVAFDEEEPFLGRIRCDSVAPPHTLASIKRHNSRVEKTPGLANADLFANISSDAPLKEGNISIFGTDVPGLSPYEPMAIVQTPIVQVESPLIPDGRYIIKNRAADIFWNAESIPLKKVHFWPDTITNAKHISYYGQVNEHSPTIQVFKS